ncbi:MAG: hypothetical protein COW63_01255 [Bacteroidetes bacterium CG18_big_fil_WC_8_21_14_2_50_41_14]|nr:MAG: hypothetical protein COW63_01255 [Bacteroidetes bacterium CG18_big_fil_WC_8_21_14_2_50_41_14]PJB59254.1 MAG: hypothetical protein CO098_04320 [Bacteroidetes bacterium CG_4_9_14_3_um_filter_41_19]
MNHPIIKSIFCFFILPALLSGLKLHGQEVTSWSKIDTNAILIGQQVNMQFGIRVADGYQVNWPVIGDTLSSKIEVIEKSTIDTLVDEGALRLMQQLTITSFDSGYFEIPSIDIQVFAVGDTLLKTTSTGTLFLKVNVPVVDTAQAIKPIVVPISEPYTFREMLPWILIGLLVIALIVLLVLYLKKRKKNQPLFERRIKPALPPHVLAINKLEELRLARVWQSGKLKQYHSEITDIMREYLDNRYHFDAPEMTSDEILGALKKYQVNNQVYEKLNGVLFLADMVKFAKARPTPLENDLSLSHCVDFVNETKEDKPENREADQPATSEISKTNNH